MSNNVSIGKESMTEWSAGNGSVGTVPAQLVAMPFPVRKHVIVRANSGNSATISIGPTSAQCDAGFILAAGATSPPIHIDDLSKVWLVGSASGQAFSWLAV